MSDICQACGSQITTEDIFCQQCGKKTTSTGNVDNEFRNDQGKSAWQRYRKRRRKTMPFRMLIAVVIIAYITLRENGI